MSVEPGARLNSHMTGENKQNQQTMPMTKITIQMVYFQGVMSRNHLISDKMPESV